jgi:hypothetical protein
VIGAIQSGRDGLWDYLTSHPEPEIDEPIDHTPSISVAPPDDLRRGR